MQQTLRMPVREMILHGVKEISWLTITAMVTYAVLYPITSKLEPYIYLNINMAFIFITITYFRYSVTLRSLPFLRPSWVRFILFAFNLSLFIYLMQYQQKLLVLHDNFYTEDFGFPKIILYEEIKNDLFRYLRMEITLFGTGSLVTIAALQIRLIISYWQFYKHKANAMLED